MSSLVCKYRNFNYKCVEKETKRSFIFWTVFLRLDVDDGDAKVHPGHTVGNTIFIRYSHRVITSIEGQSTDVVVKI